MLQQLDGTGGRKRSPPSPSSSTTTGKRRCCPLCGPRESPTESREFVIDAQADESIPMRLISPRATKFDPTTKQRKRSKCPWFKRRKSKRSSTSTHDSVTNVVNPGVPEVPVTEEMVNIEVSITREPTMQASVNTKPTRNASSGSIPALVIPASPIDELALMNYPISSAKEDDHKLEKFWTPSEESNPEKIEFPAQVREGL